MYLDMRKQNNRAIFLSLISFSAFYPFAGAHCSWYRNTSTCGHIRTPCTSLSPPVEKQYREVFRIKQSDGGMSRLRQANFLRLICLNLFRLCSKKVLDKIHLFSPLLPHGYLPIRSMSKEMSNFNKQIIICDTPTMPFYPPSFWQH